MKKKIKRLSVVLLILVLVSAPLVSAQFLDGSSEVWSIKLDGVTLDELDGMLEDAGTVDTDSDYLTDTIDGDKTIIGTDNIKEYADVVPADLLDSIQLITEDTLKSTLLNMWPVGSIYMTTSEDDPSDLIGGTWAPWGAGRVPVGVGSGVFAGSGTQGGSLGGTSSTVTVTWPARNVTGAIDFSPGSAAITAGNAAWNTSGAGVTVNNPTGLIGVTNGTLTRTQDVAVSVTGGTMTLSGGGVTRGGTPSVAINNHPLTVAQLPSHTHATEGYWTSKTATGTSRYILSRALILTDTNTYGTNQTGGDEAHNHGNSVVWPEYSLGVPSNNHSSVAHTATVTQQPVLSMTAPTVAHGVHTASVTWPVFSYTSSSLSYTPPSLGTHNLSIAGDSTDVDVTDTTLQPFITCYMWKRTA